MISTRNLSALPNKEVLKKKAKALAVLDAIFAPDWEDRYYSYNSKWGEGEECFEMRNGSGTEMHVLFLEGGCAINGFVPECVPHSKSSLTKNLPKMFQEFIYGEPVNSIGTTFCLWTTGSHKWHVGALGQESDQSEEVLRIFGNSIEEYISWASDYFSDVAETGDEFNAAVSKIFRGVTLTDDIVSKLVDVEIDWEQLEEDLKEINYPYQFD